MFTLGLWLCQLAEEGAGAGRDVDARRDRPQGMRALSVADSAPVTTAKCPWSH